MTPTPLPRADYGPIQLPGVLGWSRSEVERACDAGLIPASDIDGRPWSAGVVAELAGANRAAAHLAAASGLDVGRADIEALAERERLPVAGHYKGWPLYDPAELDALAGDGDDMLAELTDMVAERQAWNADSVDPYTAAAEVGCHPAALADLAAQRGVRPGRFGRYATADIEQLATDDQVAEQIRHDRLLGPDQAAAHLHVRRTDFDYIVAAGWVTPARWTDVPVVARKTIAVPLCRTSDIEAATEIADVDWEAVRATPPGEPSPLRAHARLPATADWLPADPAVRCRYVIAWIAPKAAWDLAVDPAENHTLTNALRSCPAETGPAPYG